MRRFENSLNADSLAMEGLISDHRQFEPDIEAWLSAESLETRKS